MGNDLIGVDKKRAIRHGMTNQRMVRWGMIRWASVRCEPVSGAKNI